MAKQVILTRGLPGSGKTTWAKEREGLSIRRVSRDDIRRMVYGPNYKHSKAREKVVSRIREETAQALLAAGTSVIFDETGFHPAAVGSAQRIAEENQARFSIQDFTYVSLSECIRRDALRGKDAVGSRVIRRMADRYDVRHPVEQYPSLDAAVIVDLDGTLAHMNGLRGPYEWDKVGTDLVDEHVRKTVIALAEDHKIIVMSGRDGRAYKDTWDWLKRHDVPFDALFMRAEGDSRKDSVVKEELFRRFVLPGYYTALVIDDRQQVVNMWRDLGLKTWQVAEGDF